MQVGRPGTGTGTPLRVSHMTRQKGSHAQRNTGKKKSR